MKRTVGLMTVAVMLCAQTGTYAADQMSKERESGQQSGRSVQSGQLGQPSQSGPSGQDMQRQSGQSGPSDQSGKSAQDMQRQSGQSGQSGQSSQPGQSGQDMQKSGQAGLSFSEEMQRQNAQIWQSGKQAQSLCQKPAQAKQASSQPSPAGDQPKQAQAGQQPTPEQSKQQAQAGQQPTPEQSKQQAQTSQQLTPEQSRATAPAQTLKGQFVRMESDFYVVKDQSGKEVCIPTSYGTFIDQTFSPGDAIVARLGQDGNALVIGRGDRQSTSSSDFAASQQGSQGQDSGAQDQSTKSADRGFSGSPQGAQSQDSGARDQSKEKGMGGSQQTASVVKGELLKIQGEFYTVKDQSGSEVRLHVNKETKMEGAVNVGDKIEAERTSSDHAISIKKAQDAGSSRNR